MKSILDKLISEAPEENQGAFEGQISFRRGGSIAGAIRHFEGDIYEATGIADKPIPGTKETKKIVTKMYFSSGDVVLIAVEVRPDIPQIITPGGNDLHIPGRH